MPSYDQIDELRTRVDLAETERVRLLEANANLRDRLDTNRRDLVADLVGGLAGEADAEALWQQILAKAGTIAPNNDQAVVDLVCEAYSLGVADAEARTVHTRPPSRQLEREQDIRGRALDVATRLVADRTDAPTVRDVEQIVVGTADRFAAWITDGTEP